MLFIVIGRLRQNPIGVIQTVDHVVGRNVPLYVGMRRSTWACAACQVSR
jgi:hypothetical protein